MSVLDAAPLNHRPVESAAPAPLPILGPLPESTTGSVALGQSVASAVEALQANKLRAFLTTLGIIIGVGAVIIMVALGEGARTQVEQGLGRLGTNVLTIVPGSGAAGGVRIGAGSLPTLNAQDADLIARQVPGVVGVSPSLSAGNVQVVAGNQNWNTTVQAGTPAALVMQDWQIAAGAAYDDNDEATSALVCDIGQTVARNLFSGVNPVGQRILVRNVPFIIKGVLAEKGSNGFRDQDDVILIPFSTAQIRLFQRTFVNNIAVQVANAGDINQVQQDITDLLRVRHHLRGNQVNDFRIQNNNQIIETVQATSDTFAMLLAGVAAVSLVVGGIGIMNIMLVSVTERTREIGIRMAIGARPSNILSQFLIEAVLLSIIGGALGILLGAGGSLVMSRLAGWNTVITIPSVLMSFGFAALVGVFFGYYPAHKASQLDPIDALRYE